MQLTRLDIMDCMFPKRQLWMVALLASLSLAACGGGSGIDAPSVPTGVGAADTAPVPDTSSILPYVDHALTSGVSTNTTMETNAGVRLLKRFLDVWTPTLQAVETASWSGVPGTAPHGTVVDNTIHTANIQYVATVTTARTADQAKAAYLDDRRNKSYSVTDGMGPLTSPWRTLTGQTTTITDIPATNPASAESDGGLQYGVFSSTDTTAITDGGKAGQFLNNMQGSSYSSNPAKNFYKYARPWRWSDNHTAAGLTLTDSVVVVPQLESAKGSNAKTDGGFASGHTAEGMRMSLAMAYLVPERFQEMMARAAAMGKNRILSGMHSPMDVMGGRIQGVAVATHSLYAGANSSLRESYAAAVHGALKIALGAGTDEAFYDAVHTGVSDNYADFAVNKANYLEFLTFGFTRDASLNTTATVPKGAEVLLETRFPYLSADQRRVVLKSTAIAAGYPVNDDAEGWGRLNLFDAAAGYGSFAGDVVVNMPAVSGSFSAKDRWKNDISGAGLLRKQGSGFLSLTGANTFDGGVILEDGTLEGTSDTAFGAGDVYQTGGTLRVNTSGTLTIAKNYTQTAGALDLVLASGGKLAVRSNVRLAGTLNVSLKGGFVPAVGDQITVLTGASLKGTFSSVTVSGRTVVPVYTSNALVLRFTS